MPPASVKPAAPLLGVGYALLAYLAWGLMPIYWKQIAEIPALQIVAHRVIWSVLVLALLVTLLKRWSKLVDTVTSRPRVALLSATAVLITGNWLTFVWAVQNGYVLEASLGYFINPLFNIVLAMAFLGERLRPVQWIAVTLAGLGVLNLVVQLGTIPWVALTLALSFGLYGLLRKIAPVDGLVGLSVETFLLSPVALAYLLHCDFTGAGTFLRVDWHLDLWVAQAGWVTALPLLWFANAAKRLRYATLGFLQYLAPTCQFLLAVALYREPLTGAHLVTFSCIWSALVIYSVDASRGLATSGTANPALPRADRHP